MPYCYLITKISGLSSAMFRCGGPPAVSVARTTVRSEKIRLAREQVMRVSLFLLVDLMIFRKHPVKSVIGMVG